MDMTPDGQPVPAGYGYLTDITIVRGQPDDVRYIVVPQDEINALASSDASSATLFGAP